MPGPSWVPKLSIECILNVSGVYKTNYFFVRKYHEKRGGWPPSSFNYNKVIAKHYIDSWKVRVITSI